MDVKKTMRTEPLGFVEEEEEVILQGEEPKVPFPLISPDADGDCDDPCRYTPASQMKGHKATEKQLLYVLYLARAASDSLNEEQKARIFQHLLEGDKWMISKVIHKLKFHIHS